MIKKIAIFFFFGISFLWGASISILDGNSAAWDITSNTAITYEKVLLEIPKIQKEIEQTIQFIPRVYASSTCSDTGCPIDSVQCDAVAEDPICPDGSVLNGDRDMCQKDPDVFKCPAGFTYDSIVGQCIRPVECPYGGTYVIERQRCESPILYDCPNGYTEENGVCVSPPLCQAGGVFNPVNNMCEIKITSECASGWSWNSSVQICERDPSCVTGTTYSSTLNTCISDLGRSCANGYSFNSIRDRCERKPVCPSGATYNSLTNRCQVLSTSATTSYNAQLTMCLFAWYYLNSSDVLWKCSTSVPNSSNPSIYCGKKNSYNYYAAEGCTAVVNPSYIVKAHTNKPYVITNLSSIGSHQCHLAIGRPDGTLSWDKRVSAQKNKLIFVGTDPNWHRKHYVDYNCVDYVNPQHIILKNHTVHNVLSNSSNVYGCPSGGNLERGKCIKTTVTCPTNYTYDGSGKCYQNPTCPSGGRFDGDTDKCYLNYSKTCSIGTYDSVSGKCIVEPDCFGGILEQSRDKCQQSKVITCSRGVLNQDKSKCIFNSDCIGSGSLNLSTKLCKADKVPLACDEGTDTALDVCYEKQNECYVNNSFVNRSTLSYSDVLKSCLVNEEVICASSLTWNKTLMKCEAVPICNYGVYNPENNFCFDGEYSCPLGDDIPCYGTEQFNHWCSPWECNSNNKCGFAYCINNSPANMEPWMPRSFFNNIESKSNSGECIDKKCDIVKYHNISYCGKLGCPHGFGVYEENDHCYKDECPDGAHIGADGNCYKLGCPTGTTEQSDGTCK